MRFLLSIILTVMTTYNSGVYNTESSVVVNAPQAKTEAVIDRLIHELQTDPQAMSDWAFAGTGSEEMKAREPFYLEWKEATYRPEDHYSKIVMDIYVNGRVMFKDAYFESFVTDTTCNVTADDGSGVLHQRDIRVDINYSGSLLKMAYGNFHVLPIDANHTQLSIDVHIRFGWFFNIFISRKMYRESVDWRVEQFMNNLKDMAELGHVTAK